MNLHRFCLAPMMGHTDRHGRFFFRQITRHARLYTEMIMAEALLHGNAARLLAHAGKPESVALQLGGENPDKLARAAQAGVMAGYDEINLNIGCPSHRVKAGNCGAALMAHPEQVATCVAAMVKTVKVPVTVKCRLGIDNQHPPTDLPAFVDKVSKAGCRLFIVHARKAWLHGVSTRYNRTVPPLDYPLVYALKQRYPQLTIVLNGGITDLTHAQRHLRYVDGVMAGRAPVRNPYMLAAVDATFFGATTPPETRARVMERLYDYSCRLQENGQEKTRVYALARHALGLYHGHAKARSFRRYLTEQLAQRPLDSKVLMEAVALMEATAEPHEATQGATIKASHKGAKNISVFDTTVASSHRADGYSPATL